MRSLLRSLLAGVVLLLTTTTVGTAQIPRVVSYQGYLALPSGDPAPDGTHNVTISIYDQDVGGRVLFSELHRAQVVRGLFNITIGGNTSRGIPDSIRFNAPYWVGVVVDGGSEMTPRTLMTTAPYAMRAGAVESAPVQAVAVDAAASPFTPTTSHDFVGVDVTAGPVLVVLPSAASVPTGKTYIIKNVAGDVTQGAGPDFHNVIVRVSGADAINQNQTEVRITWGNGVGSYRLFSDGVSRWFTY